MNARAVALPLIAVGIAAVIWWQMAPPGPNAVPAATWRVGPTDDFEQARNYHELPAESPVRLSYSCTEPRYVYVFGHSAEDGTLLMFPTEMDGAPSNPLPKDRTVLPGEREGAPLAWTTRSEIHATTTYVVVASREPVAELEELLPRLRRWSNRVLPDHSMQVTRPGGDVELAGAPRTPWPAPILQRAAERALAETQVNGPMHPDEQFAGVWSASFRVKEKGFPPSKPAGKPAGK